MKWTKAAWKKHCKEGVVDLEEGETYTQWFNDLWETMRSDGLIVKEGGKEYLID